MVGGPIPMMGFFEFLIVFAMSGIGGVPVAVPPQPEDFLVSRVAPEECLFYATWAGTATADPQSDNHTEKLIAEPEIQHLLVEGEKKLMEALAKQAEREGNEEFTAVVQLVPKWTKALLTRPTCLYITDVQIEDESVSFNGGMIVRVDDEGAEIKKALELLQMRAFAETLTTVKIDGATYHQFRPVPEGPLVTWGLRDLYLVVGVGDNALEDMFSNIRRNAKDGLPAWLTDVRKQLTVDRVSTVSYANVKKIVDTTAPLFGGPEARAMVDAMGFGNITSYASVTGLDKSGFVNRQLIGIEGRPTGWLAFANGDPLTAADLAIIPHDAPVAVSVRLDAADVYDNFVEMIGTLDARAAEEFEDERRGFEDVVGAKLREEVLASLADTWHIYASPSDGGLVTGWTAVVGVRDLMTLAKAHESLIEFARASLGDDPRAPKITTFDFDGREVYTFSVPDDDMPFQPSWCLTEKELIFALYPQAIKGHLARGAVEKSLAEREEIAALLNGEDAPLMLAHVDTRKIVQLLYPMLQMGAQFMFHELQREMEIDIDASILPSTAAITRHLQPTTMGCRKTEAGIEFFSHQTIPSSSIGASAPVMVALLLPAVSSARTAAQRMQGSNNLKQVALAMHNYHDTFKGLPPAYSTNEMDDKLLSWRVHILPFIEQKELYDRFRLDEPWDSEHNKALVPLMPQVYRSPRSKAEAGMTTYLAVSSDGSAIQPPREADKGKTEFPIGSRFADILDGTSNTIMVVEASDDAAVPWTKPEDWTPDEADLTKGLIGLFPQGFQAAFCDGSVRFLHQAIDKEMFKRLLDRKDGMPVHVP